MSNKPTPARGMVPTPEQQLERMKDLVREIIAVPKGEITPKRKKRRKH